MTVCSTDIGTPIEPRNLNRHFEKVYERAGVRRIRSMTCVSIDNVQDVLGHSSWQLPGPDFHRQATTS